MYTIQVTPEGRLRATVSGRVTTSEALRLVSQGFALAEAGAITDLLVDVRGVERGPGQWLMLAAVVSSRLEEPMRLAVVTGPRQEPVVRRILRYSGARRRAALFMDDGAALRWFADRFRGRGAAAGSRAAVLDECAGERAWESELRPEAG